MDERVEKLKLVVDKLGFDNWNEAFREIVCNSDKKLKLDENVTLCWGEKNPGFYLSENGGEEYPICPVKNCKNAFGYGKYCEPHARDLSFDTESNCSALNSLRLRTGGSWREFYLELCEKGPVKEWDNGKRKHFKIYVDTDGCLTEEEVQRNKDTVVKRRKICLVPDCLKPIERNEDDYKCDIHQESKTSTGLEEEIDGMIPSGRASKMKQKKCPFILYGAEDADTSEPSQSPEEEESPSSLDGLIVNDDEEDEDSDDEAMHLTSLHRTDWPELTQKKR